MAGPQMAVPGVYMRGGTSRALIFHARDLPGGLEDRSKWDPFLIAALGSPDPGGRQLDGMGGGISSLSKIAVVAPSTHAEADVDYIFGQVSIKGQNVSYRGNCGNISSAVGPFAIDEGLVPALGDTALVRIHHVASGKLIHAHVNLQSGLAAVDGEFTIQGVAGTGSPIRLDFLDPGGSATGALLPTGTPQNMLTVKGESILVSMIDAANPVVILRADAVGLRGDESPSEIDSNAALMARLEDIRVTASLAMGITQTEEEARVKVPNMPLVALISPPPAGSNIQVRMISAGQPHKATPMTGAMCLAVAARLPDTVISQVASIAPSGKMLIAHASGILPVDALVENGVASRTTVFQTARRLMQGSVLVPASLMARHSL